MCRALVGMTEIYLTDLWCVPAVLFLSLPALPSPSTPGLFIRARPAHLPPPCPPSR